MTIINSNSDLPETDMMKTLSFAAIHFTIAFSVVYVMTGDWVAGGVAALIEPCINTVAFYFHDKVWQRLHAPAPAFATAAA